MELLILIAIFVVLCVMISAKKKESADLKRQEELTQLQRDEEEAKFLKAAKDRAKYKQEMQVLSETLKCGILLYAWRELGQTPNELESLIGFNQIAKSIEHQKDMINDLLSSESYIEFLCTDAIDLTGKDVTDLEWATVIKCICANYWTLTRQADKRLNVLSS
ncbi:hypothetical protein LRP50_08455 [Enterovibrio sp. ZSDZ42]|uniref:DUF2489 domain-containing protein n=1 Tax=Enterovibrio gelatinilyticus TaxID=2899819 RepID=A0ABT5QZG3_9GAMM|nr:hypothetical protein [Enterovibrio sp. ZSDZ42]MDD1793154.1 hypothetical protein [Enterovibrio sp. ZSDZ42]